MANRPSPTPGVLPPPAAGISRRRQLLGAAVGVVGLPTVMVGLASHRDDVLLSTPLLLVLTVVVTVALIGGIRPALPAALTGFLLLNFVFTQPFDTFAVHRLDQALALAVYLAVAVAVSAVVGLAARRHSQAVRAAAEATELSALAGARAGGSQPLTDVLARVRDVFALDYAAIVEREGKDRWRVVESTGVSATDTTHLRVPVADSSALDVAGRPLSTDDQRVLTAFARAAVAALKAEELAKQARDAERLASIDQLRTALLAGVGHDLRTPLAGIKAAVSSLRAGDVQWSESERAELLAVIEESADRLSALVANLLAASRLEAGAVSVELAPLDVEEIVGRALRGIADVHRVMVDLPAHLPLICADIGLAERVVANLVDNALRHSGKGANVLVTAATRRSAITLSVVDTGPGVPTGRHPDLFSPYQRLGDRSTGGLGLGLSVARGFTEAMGGTLSPAHTPGGGLTMQPPTPSRLVSRILVVDDDVSLLRTLRLNLRARGYDVDAVGTGQAALDSAARAAPDLAIVDLGLPDLDGLDVITALRSWSQVPILVLSARGEQRDKVIALDAGSDDHISKPFSMEELLARVRASLRRSPPPQSPIIRTDSFALDFTARTASTAAGHVHLTPTEWHLLEELTRQPGAVVPQLELLRVVWGQAYGEESRHYLRVYMAQLRRKLEITASSPRHFVTVPGTGYRFDP